MGESPPGRRPAAIPAGLGWAPIPAVAVTIVATYSRLHPAELYHVSGTGLTGGLGRALVFLNFPVALAALPLIALAVERLAPSRLSLLLGVLAALLCAVVVVPRVVDQADLDPKAVNVIPAIGVGLAVGLAVAAGLFRAPAYVDRYLVLLLAILSIVALPWIAAEFGFFLDDVPVLGSLYLTGTVVDGHPAVHHGHHHGMDGVLLVLAALALVPVLRRSRHRRLSLLVAAYLGLQIAYGLANMLNDVWLEQVVKRGWTDVEVPSVLRPGLSLAWLGIVLSVPLFALALRRRRDQSAV